MEPNAALFLSTGIIIGVALALIFLTIREMQWRDRLHTERLASKDRAAEAFKEGSAEAVANFFRKLRWPTNEEARNPVDR